MPLSFVIVRYFFYVLVALAGVWIAAFTALSIALNAGIAYTANYGAAHTNETASALQADGFSVDAIPSAYRYLLVDDEGNVLCTDLSDSALEQALDATDDLRSEGAHGPETFGLDGTTYTVAELGDGTSCVLTSTYLPEYTSRELRDSLPNPQNLMIAAGCALSVLAIALVARRASSVLVRKMGPLAVAAERIGREELDFTVGESNVRQIDDVLAAMDRMRGSLAESLDARWRAEMAQRDQMAALAHDLKTPLTVVRANTEYVAEETLTLAKGDADDLSDVAAAARDAADGCRQVDRYVQLLIEASRGEAGEKTGRRIDASEFAQRISRATASLARAAGVSCIVEQDDALEGRHLYAHAETLERAVANVASNAVDHARTQVRLTLRLEDAATGSCPGILMIAVSDDGPGFTPAALAHGCERFFRDDASRTGAASGEHYGIGLFTASEALRALGGDLQLSNRTSSGGAAAGARVEMRVPLCR